MIAKFHELNVIKIVEFEYKIIVKLCILLVEYEKKADIYDSFYSSIDLWFNIKTGIKFH